MTESEFDRLKVGDFVADREGDVYKITMDYALGPPKQIFSAVLQSDVKYQEIRISEGNFRFYERVFPRGS
jgi:hypothetical protein